MNLRELKYVLLGEDRLSGKLRQVSQSGDRAATSLMRSSDRLAKFKRNAKEAAREIPGVGRAMSLIMNPVALGAAAVVGLGAALRNTAKEASKFNSTFRDLQNLNINKTPQELAQLRGLVRHVSSRAGFDPNKTSTAFYDVQSVTGKYGGQVAKIVETQGTFANIMNADFNNWIAGTGKAMANFGFGAEALDDFNRSAYATIQVGALTFDELAKVQSVYAGTAAAAGQSFDSANKMVAMFSLRTKRADEAATLTKSLFNDLTKASSIDALKKVGISLYETDGTIKQVDKIMVELNQKFAELGGQDSRIMNLKNEFTGSDGFIQMVQMATDQSGGLLRTLKDFDGAKVNMEFALSIAEKDINYINDRLRGEITTLKTEIWEDFLPIWESFLKGAKRELRAAKGIFMGGKMGATAGASDAIIGYDAFMYDAGGMDMQTFYAEREKLNNEQKYAYEMKKLYEPYKWMPGYNKRQYSYWESYGNELGRIESVGYEARKLGVSPERPDWATRDDTVTPDPNDPLQNGLNSVSGGGNQIRNITVNIAKLIESQNINTKNLTEGSPQIQQKVEEALIRAISGTEQMLAGG